MCDIPNFLLNIAFRAPFLKRKNILLIDNIFNDEAELVDNFTLFEYLQSRPEYKDISYYIINKNNVQYPSVAQKYKNIIPVSDCKINRTLLKKLMGAKYWLDSFQVLNRLNLQKHFKKSKIINVYTQHGINYFKSGFWGNQSIGEQTFRKIIFANEQERLLFKQYYAYDDQNTILAGLARWDLMKEIEKPTDIFAYFTFRVYLRDPKLPIQETTYFKNILALVSSTKLQNILKARNINLNLALHHEVFRFLNEQVDSIGNIRLIPDAEIGSVKQKASLLITDYSSMCFDFMFKNRPVVFYRLDKDEPMLNNDRESKINNENVEAKNGELYNISYTAKDTVDIIERYINNNFTLEAENVAKNDVFFAYRENICEKIINGIYQSPDCVYNPEYVLPKEAITLGQTYSFARHDNHFGMTGVSNIESWGRWSNDTVVDLMMRIGEKQLPQKMQVAVLVRSFLTQERKRQKVKVYANGKLVKRLNIKTMEKEIRFTIPAALLKENMLRLQFKIKNPQSPMELGLSSDSRKLAIGFKTITIKQA